MTDIKMPDESILLMLATELHRNGWKEAPQRFNAANVAVILRRVVEKIEKLEAKHV